MKEYIEREKVIEVFENSNFDISDCDGYTVTPGISIGKFYELINSVPNDDVVEVVHGKWNIEIDEDIGILKHTCSKCGFVKFTDIHVGLDWNYCPNCGVKLDLEE